MTDSNANELEPGDGSENIENPIPPSSDDLDGRRAEALARLNKARDAAKNPIANVAKAAQELNKEEPPKE